MYKLDNKFHNRFKDANWYNKEDGILIAGAGGIGSWLSLYLARAGFNEITVVDFDIIEEHNMSGQLLKKVDIGKHKVESLKDVVNDYTNVNINGIVGNIQELDEVPSIVFSALDNMKAREKLFNLWKNNKNKIVFIDGRLSFDTMHIYTVQNNEEDIKNYEKSLYSDKEASQEVCTLKQTSHIAGGIAFLMTVKLLNIIDNKYGGNTYIPFKQIYSTQIDSIINKSANWQ